MSREPNLSHVSYYNHYDYGFLDGNTGQPSPNNSISRAGHGPQYFVGHRTGSDQDQAREERIACLRSLCFGDIDARQQDIAFAHPQTCDWLFDTKQFRQWRDRTNLSSHNGVLWIKGNPGTGKSTLMKHAWRHYQVSESEESQESEESGELNDYNVAAYFFNARGTALEKTPLGMLRSLVYQLLDRDTSIYGRFIPLFRAKVAKHRPGGWNRRESELKEFLLSEIRLNQPKPILLLIDALDECSESNVRHVVEFLEQLSVNALKSQTALNICLSSRHYPHISMAKFDELVVEKTEEHAQDIAIYVRDKLTTRNAEIERGILDKASGIFMWVVLVVTMLNKAFDEGKIEAMHQILSEVPEDLDELFWALISQNNPDKHETILMLQWVLFAQRPLRPEELYYATLAGTNTRAVGSWDPSIITSPDIWRRIVNSSRGLIEVRQSNTRMVQFIHESVNDFLIRNGRLQKLDEALEGDVIATSHDRLKTCCMSYIMIDALPVPGNRWSAAMYGADYPFLEYASRHLLDHAETAATGHVDQTKFLRQLVNGSDAWERVRLFHSCFDERSDLNSVQGASPLYMSSAYGYSNLVRILLVVGADIDALGGVHGTSLQAAAYYGYEETMTELLMGGANVNIQGGSYSTALYSASSNNHHKIVTMLLDKGANINAQGGEYGTALQVAASKARMSVLGILLRHGADVNVVGGHYGTALQAAAYKGHDHVIKKLLDDGADIDAHGGLYNTALQAAAYIGHKHIVELLLSRGADINAEAGEYGTALQMAAYKGHEHIVLMLLRRGAKTNVLDGRYGTALQAAVHGGHAHIVEMLLRDGVWQSLDIDALSERHGTALQVAAREGHEHIVHILLRHNANVNAQGGPYGTAVRAAEHNGYHRVVSLLVQHGAVRIDGHYKAAQDRGQDEKAAAQASEYHPKQLDPPKQQDPAKKLDPPKQLYHPDHSTVSSGSSSRDTRPPLPSLVPDHHDTPDTETPIRTLETEPRPDVQKKESHNPLPPQLPSPNPTKEVVLEERKRPQSPDPYQQGGGEDKADVPSRRRRFNPQQPVEEDRGYYYTHDTTETTTTTTTASIPIPLKTPHINIDVVNVQKDDAPRRLGRGRRLVVSFFGRMRAS